MKAVYSEIPYISPQGLSQAIQQLEKEFGTALFYRDGSKLHLTAAGSDAYALAREILCSSDALQRKMSSYRAKDDQAGTDELFLCTSPLPTMTFLPAVIRKFHRRNPRTAIHVQELGLAELLGHARENPRRNEILLFNMEDLEFEDAFRDHPLVFNIHPLVHYDMMACASSQSPLSRRKSVGPAEFCSHPLVLFNFSQRTLHRLVPQEEKVEVLMAGNSLLMSRTLLETDPETVGFSSYLDELYFKNPALTSVPLDPPVRLVMGYLETAPELTTPAIRDFLRLLESEVPHPQGGRKENAEPPARNP